MSVERTATNVDGVSVVHGVKVVFDAPDITGTILHFFGVVRGLGGVVLKCYLAGDVDISTDFYRSPDGYLGELAVYATDSPRVSDGPSLQLRAGMPEPLPLESYETHIDVSEMASLIIDQGPVEIILVVVGSDGEPTSDTLFEFSDLKIRTSEAAR